MILEIQASTERKPVSRLKGKKQIHFYSKTTLSSTCKILRKLQKTFLELVSDLASLQDARPTQKNSIFIQEAMYNRKPRSSDQYPQILISIYQGYKINGYTSGHIKTRPVKQRQFCSFFLKELGGHLNDIKGLTQPFTYVGMFYFLSFKLKGEAPHPKFLSCKYQLWWV